MAHDLELIEHSGFLEVRSSGARTRESVVATAVDMHRHCIERDFKRALIDIRPLEGRISTADSYQLASVSMPVLQRAGLLDRVAVLDSEEAYKRLRFFEDAAQNRGFNIRIFHDRDEAIRWLTKR